MNVEHFSCTYGTSVLNMKMRWFNFERFGNCVLTFQTLKIDRGTHKNTTKKQTVNKYKYTHYVLHMYMCRTVYLYLHTFTNTRFLHLSLKKKS